MERVRNLIMYFTFSRSEGEISFSEVAVGYFPLAPYNFSSVNIFIGVKIPNP